MFPTSDKNPFCQLWEPLRWRRGGLRRSVTGRSLTGSTGPTFSRRSFPALKNGTLLEATRTASPVLGLRASRALRLRARKLPKPRNSTLSPSLKASVMHVNKTLTTASVCLLVRWSLSATLAASSDFFTSSVHPKEHLRYAQARRPFAPSRPDGRSGQGPPGRLAVVRRRRFLLFRFDIRTG